MPKLESSAYQPTRMTVLVCLRACDGATIVQMIQ